MEKRSGAQPDGSSHLGPELLHPHLQPGENGAQTKRVRLLIFNQLIEKAQIKRAKDTSWQSHYSWQ